MRRIDRSNLGPTDFGVVGPKHTSPCLGFLDVTPLRARLEFSHCHYITVASPSGGVGGFNSVSFNAFRT